jgi:microcin C transport system permease protein
MLTYLIRRLLLFVPTLIGATIVVFAVIAMAPGGISASAGLDAEGSLKPEVRVARERYLNARFGLDKPYVVQYGRWLNNVSPIGFATRQQEDADVVAASREEQRLQGEKRESFRASGKTTVEIERIVSEVKVGPDAGEILFTKPRIKVPDLGESFIRGRRVSSLLGEALPITLLLQCISLPITYYLAIVTGVFAARHRGKAVDIASGTISLALWSVPVIWVAVLSIGFLANDRYLKLFPTNGLSDIAADRMNFLPGTVNGEFQRGWLMDYLWHLALPVICLSYGSLAFLHKLGRAAMLDNIASDYVRTARAKGVSESRVLWGHAFVNSLIPLITVFASLLPLLITGSIVVEKTFGINGMGRLAIEAIQQRDRELFLSITLVTMCLTLLGNLLADIAYVIADPRVSYE